MFYTDTVNEKKTRNFLPVTLKKQIFWNEMSPRTSNIVLTRLMHEWHLPAVYATPEAESVRSAMTIAES